MPGLIPRPLRPERRLIFGDALQAQLIHVTEGLKDVHTGEELIQFRFVPLDYLRWQYQITDEQYTNKQEWWIERTYPKKMCKQLNKSPFTASWLIFQTFDRKAGLEIEEINKELELRYEDMKNRYELQSMIVAKLREDLRNLVNQPDYLKDKAVKDIETGMRAATATSAVPAPGNEQTESEN